MADRVAVFNHGRIEQVGAPKDIYDRPRTRFVADFVGGSNVVEPALVRRWTGLDRPASLRPETIVLVAEGAEAPEGAVVIEARVEEVLFHGAVYRIEASAADAGRLVVSVPASAGEPPTAGARIRAAFDRCSLHLMEAE
jgi:putative spermidine/putrescine transport system ATP-binding protein